MLWVKRNARGIMPDPQTHQGIAGELLPGQFVTRFLAHPPAPGQILVGDPLVTEASIGLPRVNSTSISSRCSRNATIGFAARKRKDSYTVARLFADGNLSHRTQYADGL
jgi:hypothetical protein